jgi:hypothetical protein
MTIQIEAKNLNDVAAALCATRANWDACAAMTAVGIDGTLFNGTYEARSMVYGRAIDLDSEAFEAYRTLTALFYVLKAFTRGYGRADTACARFARRFT